MKRKPKTKIKRWVRAQIEHRGEKRNIIVEIDQINSTISLRLFRCKTRRIYHAADLFSPASPQLSLALNVQEKNPENIRLLPGGAVPYRVHTKKAATSGTENPATPPNRNTQIQKTMSQLQKASHAGSSGQEEKEAAWA